MKNMQTRLFVLAVAVFTPDLASAAEDQISLLQGEMEKAAENRKNAAEQVPLNVGGEDSSCRASLDGEEGNVCGPKDKVPRAKHDGGKQPHSRPASWAETLSPTTEKAVPSSGPTAFGWFLYFLVFLLACDGVRRWRSEQADGAGEKDDSSSDAWEALMQAAGAGDAGRFSALLANGIDGLRSDLNGSTVLHAAAHGGSEDVVQQLLKQTNASVDALDAFDETPLHVAARAGHAEICKLLVEQGAAYDAGNAQSLTPLLVAAKEGKEAACKALLEYGASVAGLEAAASPQLFRTLLPKDKQMDDLATLEREAVQKQQKDVEQEFLGAVRDD